MPVFSIRVQRHSEFDLTEIAIRIGPHIGLATAPWVCMRMSIAASKRLRGSIKGRISSISLVKPLLRPCTFMIIFKHDSALAGALKDALCDSGNEAICC